MVGCSFSPWFENSAEDLLEVEEVANDDGLTFERNAASALTPAQYRLHVFSSSLPVIIKVW